MDQGRPYLRHMKIIPLSEGSFTIDKTKLFVPFDEDVHELQDRPVGSLLVEIQPFIVITSKDVLFLIQALALMIKDKAKCNCIQTLKKTELSLNR